MMTGIYRITNKVNGKFYIGSSLFCEHRKKTHFSKLKHNYADNKHLQSAWNKYGSENFVFEVIAQLPDDISDEKIAKIEAYFIKTLRPQYNKTLRTHRGGKSHKIRERNKKHVMTGGEIKAIYSTAEHRDKMSRLTKKYYQSLTDEEKRARNAHKVGRVFSEETRKKLSEKAKQRKWSDEVKSKISQSLKGKGRS